MMMRTEGKRSSAQPLAPEFALEQSSPTESGTTGERAIGHLLRRRRPLSDAQIDQVLEHQAHAGLRFGEAAVALKLVSQEDVTWALFQQFHYPYAPGGFTRNRELIVAADPFCPAAEAFRELRSVLNLSNGNRERSGQALAVISPNSGDGRTFVAANLAIAFSQLGRRTLVIDADMRRPRLHRCFGVPNHTGLSALLSGATEERVIRRVLDLPNVYVLPVGTAPPNPLELAESKAMDRLLAEVNGSFDQIIVDTPAVECGADARVISSKCAAVLTVCRKGRTTQKSLQAMIRWLQIGDARLAGMIMNDYPQ